MSAGIVITGMKELERKFKELDAKVAKKIVRKSVRAGAKVAQRKAKENARTMVGGNMGRLIAKYLKLLVWRRQRPGAYGMGLTISEKGNDVFVVTSKDGRRNYIPHAIEFGHALPGGGRARAKAKRRRQWSHGILGRTGSKATVPAIPFFRSAYETAKDEATRVIEQTMWRGIEQAAKA